MRPIENLFSEYGESHRNATNKLIHWICVPLIFFSVTGLLYGIKLPVYFGGHQLNMAMIVTVIVLLYYVTLSASIAIGMLFFTILCLFFAHVVEQNGIRALRIFCIIIFVAAWIGQFYGHKIEGKKPSFLKDFLFLIIGPAWLMSFIYKKLGIGL